MLDRLKKLFRPLKTGERGERLAARWLSRERGFVILARNWRNPRDEREELDIVALDGEVLVFVEVKTRAAGGLVRGYHAVDARKKEVLRRVAATFVVRMRKKPRTVRFDIVEVTIPDNTELEPEVRHFANIPLFGKYWRP